jgi:tetratricopeptide (TPR) repeat protein
MLIKKQKSATRYGQTVLFNQAQKPMSTQLENDPHFDDAFFQQNLPQYYRAILRDFRKTTRSFVTFNLLYLSAFLSEVTLFFFFLPSLVKSAIFAFALGGIFLTCFSYFVLLFYLQAKKPEQLLHLKDRFLQSCRQILSLPPGEAQHHLSLADALSKLATYLEDFECNFYKSARTARIFPRLISRFSSYCYGEDVFKMKLLLLQAAVDEHLKQIRMTPTDLEVHASLANTYVALSKLYKEDLEEEKHQRIARLAIEEFSILSNYAPNDPWVHEQLAIGYHDLGMPKEEMTEVEILLKLRAQDREILYRLGSLYFKQGMNAKGLQIYEELKKANYKKAEDLITSYGHFSP